MSGPLRVLIVEDHEDDAELLAQELRRQGYRPTFERVETRDAMRAALLQAWDVVICDWSLPQFSAMAALAVVREANLDLPFIIVSGTVDEDIAVEALHAGAHDFMAKGRLKRLVPAISREIREVKLRAEHRATEQQLRQTQKMEALGTLAGGMAHDINNCLVPILSLTTLALDTMPPDSPECTYIELIKEAGERIRDLVGRILVFSRREEVVYAPIDLAALLKESVSLLRATLPATIGLRSRVKPDAAIVQGNASQIRQVLMNLCVNAGDAIGDRSGGAIEVGLDAVDLQIPVEAVGGRIAPGAYHRLRVADNGTGMDEATIARIFEPFYTTKEPGKGTGLGLAMVHTIVHSHAGHLRVTSRPGAGTEFEVYLPESSKGVSKR